MGWKKAGKVVVDPSDPRYLAQLARLRRLSDSTRRTAIERFNAAGLPNPVTSTRSRRKPRTSKTPPAPVSYRSYVASDGWASRRRRYFGSHPKTCAACGSKTTVELHHLRYDHLGREPDSDLVALCQRHHGQVHSLVATAHIDIPTATRRIIGTSKRQALLDRLSRPPSPSVNDHRRPLFEVVTVDGLPTLRPIAQPPPPSPRSRFP